ncbi:hypothetical protein Tco_1377324 [Tanacetum coccineum]
MITLVLIMGYGDYVIGDSVISRVYYVEGLRHNLFSVGQFCDSDLEVAFRKHSCYVRDTDGVELLKEDTIWSSFDVTHGLREVKFLRSQDETPTVVIKVSEEDTSRLKQDCQIIPPGLMTGIEPLVEAAGTMYLLKGTDVSLGLKLGLLPVILKKQSLVNYKQGRIGIFIGSAKAEKRLRIYHKRNPTNNGNYSCSIRKWTEQMALYKQSRTAPNLLTPGPISSGLVPNPAPVLPYVPPTNKELEMLFQPMFDEYFNPPGNRLDPLPSVAQVPVIPAGEQYAEVNPFAVADHEPFVNVFALDPTTEASSSEEIMMPN